MESVFNMLRPLYFMLFFAAIAFLAFAAAEENEGPPSPGQSEIEGPSDQKNDLETDATYWGYGRPWRYYGGWGYGGRGYGGYYGGWGGGWRGGYGGWGGRGWGGRGYGGGGWGYWG